MTLRDTRCHCALSHRFAGSRVASPLGARRGAVMVSLLHALAGGEPIGLTTMGAPRPRMWVLASSSQGIARNGPFVAITGLDEARTWMRALPTFFLSKVVH